MDRKTCLWGRLAAGVPVVLMALQWSSLELGAQTPLSPTESPAASGFFNACPTSTLSGTGSGNGHVYSFEAEAGDEVTVWIDGSAGSYPKLRIRNVGGSNLATNDGSVFGVASIQAYEIPAPGTYTVLVYSDHVAMDYTLRFDLGRQVDLETEGNDEIANADILEYSGLSSPYTLRMAGALEDVDVYSLGTLNAGNSMTLGLLRPSASTLQAGDGILTLRKSDGSAVATSATESLNFTVVDDDAYFLEVGLANLSGETLELDGSDDGVNLGNPAQLQMTGDTTIEFWIKPDVGSFNTRRNPWAKAWGGEGTMTIETDGTINFFYGTNGGNGNPYQTFNTVKPLVAGQWNHVALVRRLDSAPQKLFWYLDGVLVNEADADYFPAVAGTLDALIGTGYTSPVKGEMDEVKVWNVVRSAAEVLADMGAAAAGTEPGLVGYWKMEDRTVDPLVLTDETANNLDGVVSGTPEWGGQAGSETFAAARAGRKGLYLIEATITDGEAPAVDSVELVPVFGHIFPGTTYAPTSIQSAGLRGNNGTTYNYTVVGTTSGTVWGTGVYTDDSRIGKAAVHAGILEPGEIGVVAVTVLADAGSYVGSTQNGTSSSSHGSHPGAYSIAAGTVTPPYDGLYSSARVEFSETVDQTSVSDVANYEVRGAGPNGTFDDGDDVLYPVTSVNFDGERQARVFFDGAPLAPEQTRVRVTTGVVDRAGNALAANHDYSVTVAQKAGYATEVGSRNGYFGSAELAMASLTDQAGDGIWTYTTATGDGPNRVELLHADADGILDIVVLNDHSDDLRVHLGVGDGTFGPGTSYPVGDRPLDMTLIDFDGDTDLDVVVPAYNHDVMARLQNNGDGTFTALASLPVGDAPYKIERGNFNGDAHPDLAVTNYNNGDGGYHISVLLGDGAAGFTEVVVGQGLSPAVRPGGIAVGDFDGINGDDLAVGDSNADDVKIFLNDGAGGFLAPTAVPVGGADQWSTETADFNNDGHLDLVSGGEYRNRIAVVLGNGDGTFQPFTEWNYGYNQYNYNIVLGDYDGDGNVDLFLPGTTDLAYFRGKGDGTFEPSLRYNNINRTEGVAFGDVNGDGWNDFMLTRFDSDQVLTMLGHPARTLTVDGTEGRMRHGYGRGYISDTSDHDYFQFTAEAGQRMVLAFENPVIGGSQGLRFRILDASTNVYVTDYGNSTGNRGETNQVTFSKTGNYFVEVYHNYQYFGEYRFRATLLESPIGIESESNNATGNADGVPLALGVGQLTGSMSGYISWLSSDHTNGDYYSVGNLGEGTQLTVDITIPAVSSLVPVLRIYRDTTEVAVSSPGDAQLTYTVGVGEADTYRVRVTQDGGTAGLNSAYLVDFTAADLVAPEVLANTLPAEGSTVQFPGPWFYLTFSEDMLASTVNDLANYELLASGGDGTFGDGNEVSYGLAVPNTYSSGTSFGLRITDGPLQADDYRFRAKTGLRDKTNNPLGSEHVRLFSVVDDAVFLTEGRDNGSFGTAEYLNGTGQTVGFDRGFYRTGTTGSGIDNPHFPQLLHLNDTGAPGFGDDVLDLVVVNHDTHDISVLLGNGDGTFGTATNLPVGTRPIYTLLLDVDGDGDQDVIVESRDSDRFDVFENQLNGTLTPLGTQSTGDSPHQMAAGDFDHADGLDFVISNFSTNAGAGGRSVSVMTGDGAGGFTETRVTPPGGSPSFRPYAVEVADVNEDGWDDLLVGDWDTDDVVVFLNDGTGGFPTASYLPLPDADPSAIRAGDLDNDGHLDLAVTTEYHNAYALLRGNGDGTFEPFTTVGLGNNSYQYALELNDLDGDGLLDVLVPRDNGVHINYNRTAAPGDPFAFTGGLRYAHVSGGRGLDIGDLNKDGRPDIVAAAAYQNLVHVYLGQGPARLVTDTTDGRLAHAYVRGNLSDSSDHDYYRFTANYGERIVLASEGPPGAGSAGRQLYLYDGNGNHVLSAHADSQGRVTSSPYFVSAPGVYYLRVAQNYAANNWEYRIRVTTYAPGVQVESENNNGTNNADGLAFTTGAGTLSATVGGYLPTNDSGGVDHFLLGNLSPGNEVTFDFTAPELSTLAAVMQLKNSSGTVVAASTAGDPQLMFTIIDSSTYYLAVSGNPKGIHAQYLIDIAIGDSVPPQVTAVNLPAEGTTASYVAPAFTVTFSEDMLASTVTEAANYDLRAAGDDGTFDTADDDVYTVVPRSYSSGLNAVFDVPDGPLQPGSYRFTVGTGLTDKLGLALPATYVRLFTIEAVTGFVGETRSNDTIATADVLTTQASNGAFDGGFSHTHTVNPGDFPLAVALEDLDGDGNLDAVVANLNGDSIATLAGDGTGQFGAPTAYPTGNDAVRMLAFDWDKDNDLDFVIANRNEDRVYLFANPGDGTLTPLGPITVGDNPLGMAWGDFDGDTNPDFAVGIFGTNGTTGRAVSVLLGDGTGAFVHSLVAQGQLRCHNVAVGDFDGNGLDDIAATDYDSDDLRILLATGGGAFAAPSAIDIDDTDHSYVETADFNQDGSLDLVVMGEYDNNVSILQGNGDGTFATPWTLGLNGNAYHWFISTKDINGDGWPDLAVGRDNGMELRYNQPGAEIAFGNNFRFDDYGKVEGFDVGDINNDGRPDLLFTAPNADRLYTLLGNTDLALAADTTQPGMRQGYGRGYIRGTSDVDYWKFSGDAGQRMFLTTENPGNPGGTGKRYRILNGQGVELWSVYNDSNGRLHSGYTLPYDGTYYLLVSHNYNASNEYRFSMALFDNAIHYESENNNNTGQADGLSFELNAGTRSRQVFGAVHSNDSNGDYFDLGGLAEGTQIALSLSTPGPERSTLDPTLRIYDSSGTEKAAGAAGDRTLNYTVGAGEGGTFYARVTSATRDFLARYQLLVQLTDTLPPEITATSLPAEGSTSLGLWESFTLTTNEDLLASTVNDLANYELVEAGPDGVFGSSDDVASTLAVSNYTSGQTITLSITDGPLVPGDYRFTASDSITDTFGAALLSDFVRSFSVGQVPGFTTGVAGNNTAGTATPLAVVEDPTGLLTAAGRARLVNGSDSDHWTFAGTAGDLLVLDTQMVYGNAAWTFRWRVYAPSGATVVDTYIGTDDWGNFAPVALPETGDYRLLVTVNNGYYNEYRFRISMFPGHDPETEVNGAISQSDALTMTNAGGVDSGSGAGFIQSTGDLDYFSIGTVDAGKTVFLNVQLPAASDFNPVVALYNSGGQLMAESNGTPGDGAAEVPINTTADYHVLVRNSGLVATDLMDQYVVTVQILDTALVNFPNLQVTDITLPPQAGLQSGDGITFTFEVSNVGTDGTGVSSWVDRAVMSQDQTFGNADDIEVAFETRSGALADGANYVVNAAATIPDGTVGDYYLLVRTDLNNQVDELYLEGDNTSVSSGTFPVALRAYPDLVVENLTATAPGGGGGPWVLDWDLANRGSAAAPGNTKERVRVVNTTTGAVVLDDTRTVANALGIGATEARTANVAAVDAGNYLVTVTADAQDDVFEHNGTSHGVAEVNAFTTSFQILQYWDITVAPSDPAHGTVQIGASGTSATVLDGASVTVTATPDTSTLPYQFAQWRTAGGAFVSAQQNYTFAASQDLDLVAVFQLPTFQVTASVTPVASGSVSGTGSFSYNGTANLTATPSAGYLFGHWKEGGVNISSNANLALTVTADRVLTAVFEEANPSHDVTTATSPAAIAAVTGAGTYTNGQVANISAPASVIDGATEYLFDSFTLNGAHFGSDRTFSKTFSTLDPPNMAFVAVYTSRPVNPVVASVGVNYTPPVPAADNVVFTLFFDRPMDTGTDPTLSLSSLNAAAVPAVPAGGTWISDTQFESLAVTFGAGNNGSFTLSASGAIDTQGRTMDPADVFGFDADTIPPANPVVVLDTSDGNSATVQWNAYVAPVDINGFRMFRLTSDFASVTGLQPLTSVGKNVRSYRFTGLTPDTDYWVAAQALDVAGNSDPAVTTLRIFLDSDIPPPVPFTVTATGPDTALVDWSAFNPAGLVGFEGFQVFAETSTFNDVAALTPVGTFGAGDTSVELDNLDRSQTYSIAVVGFNRLNERDTAVVPQTWEDPLRGTVTQNLAVGTVGGTETVDVFEDVVIGGGATLTIRPGTTMRFAAGTSLTIENGILDAQGTQLLPINFTSATDVPGGTPQRGDWDGLILEDGTNHSQLAHVWVRYGRGLQLVDAQPVVNGLYAVWNAGQGLKTSGGAMVGLAGAYLALNDIGVLAEGTSTVAIGSSVLKNHTTADIQQSGGSVVDASGNWWGSAAVGTVLGTVTTTNPLAEEPVLYGAAATANGVTSTTNPILSLKLASPNAVAYRLSENSSFPGVLFQDIFPVSATDLYSPFAFDATFNLSPGGGLKTVYAQFQSVTGEVTAAIPMNVTFITNGPSINAFSLADGQVITRPLQVTGSGSAPLGVDRVQFLADGVVVASSQTAALNFRWDMRALPAGTTEARLVVRDNAGSEVTRTVNVVLSPLPPPKPVIVSHANGAVVPGGTLNLTGTAEPLIGLRVIRNGVLQTTGQADASGNFLLTNVGLVEGNNDLQVVAFDDLGSTASDVVTVEADSGPPVAPILVVEGYTPGRGFDLSWTLPDGEAPARYRVFWHGASFADPATASGMSGLLTLTDYTLGTAPDGTTYIGVVGYDQAGNASALSNLEMVTVDQTAPSTTITYDQAMPVGPGDLGIVVTSSEPLATNPLLTIQPSGQSTLSVPLTKTSGTTYTATYPVTALSAASGTAVVRVTARDLAGNTQTAAPTGDALVFDVTKPTGALAFDQVPPVGTSGGNVTLSFNLTLSEAAAAGTTPTLMFTPPVGPALNPALSGAGTAWSGSIVLTAAMGNGDGLFNLSAEDAAGNTGTVLTVGEKLEVFNTADPSPPGIPVGLDGEILSGGRFRLTWNPVDRAETYTVYREPGNGSATPTVVLADGLAGTEILDTTIPADGFYRYAVTASRRGVEGTPSGTLVGFSDSTPPDLPENFTAVLTDQGVVIDFDAPSGGDVPHHYLVFRNGTQIRNYSTPRSTTDRPPKGSHDYTVASVDPYGNMNVTPPITIELFVDAVTDLDVAVVPGSANTLTWDSSDPTAVGFNFYRNGVKQNSAPIVTEFYQDLVPNPPTEPVRYSVSAVNGAAQESARKTVTVFPLSLALTLNPDADGLTRASVEQYFDIYRVALTNLADPAAGAMTWGSFDVERDVGTDMDQFGATIGADIAGGATVSQDLVVPSPQTPGLDQELTVTLVQTFEGQDSVVSYRYESTQLPAVTPPLMVEVTTPDTPLAGGLTDVQATLINNGFAPIDIVLVTGGGSDAGDVYVSVQTPAGVEVQRKDYDVAIGGLTYAANGDGYVTLEPGQTQSITIPQVLIPEALADEGGARIVVAASKIYHRRGLSGERLSGPISGSMSTGLVETPYYATSMSSHAIYSGTGTITISGTAKNRATDLAEPDVDLKLGFSAGGAVWYQDVVADATGAFTYDYTPLAGFSGELRVWAAHPDVFDQLNQVTIAVYRVYVTPGSAEVRMSKNDTLDFTLTMVNPGSLNLSGISAAFRAFTVDGGGAETNIGTITGSLLTGAGTGLEPRETKDIGVQLLADAAAPDEAMVEITLSTAEGAETVFLADLTLTQPIPILSVVSPKVGYVQVSLDRGDVVSREVEITNRGLRALEDVEITPPQNVDWMQINLPADPDGKIRLPDLGVGETMKIGVVFSPSEAIAQGDYDDIIRINGSNSPQNWDLNLYARVTSDLTGDVHFYVDNILVQPVPNATIRIRNLNTGADFGPFNTDVNGEYTVTGLMEGDWSWKISASGHTTAAGVVTVLPDQTAEVEQRLDKSLVTVNFTVVPVPYTDRYEIKLEQTFETHVPAPVLVQTPASTELTMSEESNEATIIFTVKNEGLIALFDVEIKGVSNDEVSIRPLVNYLPRLGAQETVQVPAVVLYHKGDVGETGGAVQTGLDIYDCYKNFKFGEVRLVFLATDGDYSCADGAPSNTYVSSTVNINVDDVIDFFCDGWTGKILGKIKYVDWGCKIVNVIKAIACVAANLPRGRLGGGSGPGGFGGFGGFGGGGFPYSGGIQFCVTGDTPVRMADGTERVIRDVGIGDAVFANATTGATAEVVSRTERTVSEGLLRVDAVREDGTAASLKVTGEHRLWVDGEGWKAAEALRAGDWLSGTADERLEVTEVTPLAGEHTVYSLIVSGEGSFYAGGILVEEGCGEQDANDPTAREVLRRLNDPDDDCCPERGRAGPAAERSRHPGRREAAAVGAGDGLLITNGSELGEGVVR